MPNDKQLIAAKQQWEMQYICRVFKVPMSVLKDVVKKVGRSRRKVYTVLTFLGYKFSPSKKK